MALNVGSNLDVNSIVTQLMVAEQRPLSILTTKETSYKAKLSAYGALSSALSSFQAKVATLSDISKFMQFGATSTDATIASATASASVKPGQYEIEVLRRAQAQSLSTEGRTSTSAAIGAGGTTTLTFQFGKITGGTLTGGQYSGAAFAQDASQSTSQITIDASNNSLQGIRDAINKAGMGVTATIVSDGTDAPYKLQLTSTSTGESSSMKITVDGDADLQNLLAQDPAGTQKLKQNSAAQDVLLTVNGMEIKNKSNTLTDTFEGLSITASKIGTTTISVTRNTSSIESSVTAFVTAYNELQGTLKYQTGYNADTKTGGPLVGDATARTVQTTLQRMFSTQPEGLTGDLVNLSQIGISFQKDGTLTLDATKLKAVIAKNPEDIGKLFATTATPTDSLVSYVSSTAATKAGSNALNITTLATKGQLTGSSAANTNIVAGVNDELSLEIDGVKATVKLAAGSYTADSLSTQLQSLINGTPAFSEATVAISVTNQNGVLSITSNRYGSASKVTVAGNGATALLGSTPTATTGVDVAGTINGAAATGSGQFLTGAAGSSAEGLKLQITGGALGARGDVNFSMGYASNLNALLTSFVGAKGLIAGRTDGINQSIKDLGTQRDAINQRLVDIEARYRKEFTALDVLLSSMNSTSNYLTQQLAALPSNTN
ncbi:flagellar filament capping protein FliD [Herminiimonas sp. NPDC097707]|uniref:flagellar filament capping protein FliD n=1 Tax=Herminiimonas sp. NPDC097707 TaxID=3364007 RepID=UPI003839E1AE